MVGRQMNRTASMSGQLHILDSFDLGEDSFSFEGGLDSFKVCRILGRILLDSFGDRILTVRILARQNLDESPVRILALDSIES